MATDGTRIFLLGGILSPDAKVIGSKLIYVLDTSMYSFLFFYSSRLQPENSKHRANHVPESRLELCQF